MRTGECVCMSFGGRKIQNANSIGQSQLCAICMQRANCFSETVNRTVRSTKQKSALARAYTSLGCFFFFFDRSLLLLLLFGEQSKTERLRAQMLWHISAENLICAVSTDKWQNVCDSKVFHSRIIFLSLSKFFFSLLFHSFFTQSFLCLG